MPCIPLAAAAGVATRSSPIRYSCSIDDDDDDDGKKNLAATILTTTTVDDP